MEARIVSPERGVGMDRKDSGDSLRYQEGKNGEVEG